MNAISIPNDTGTDNAVDVLKSMAHPGRFRILGYLAKNPATVGQIETFLNMNQSAVSKSLLRLRESQLVKTQRVGRFIEYSIADTRVHKLVSSLQSTLAN